LFATLSIEWADLVRSPAMSEALRGWALEDPRLRFGTMGDLVAAVERRDDRSHDVLAALAGRAPTDDLAARTLLQLLVPALSALARRLWALGDADERAAAVVATAYERIRTYPIERRPRHVAANVVWDTTQRLLASISRQAPNRKVRGVAVDESGALGREQCDDERGRCWGRSELDEPASAAEELIGLLAWARRRGHITADAAELIALTRVADVPAAALAPRFGRDAQGVRRRRLRAECALKAAVLAAA
jgi:hypothetical protein